MIWNFLRCPGRVDGDEGNSIILLREDGGKFTKRDVFSWEIRRGMVILDLETLKHIEGDMLFFFVSGKWRSSSDEVSS